MDPRRKPPSFPPGPDGVDDDLRRRLETHLDQVVRREDADAVRLSWPGALTVATLALVLLRALTPPLVTVPWWILVMVGYGYALLLRRLPIDPPG